MTAPTPTPPEPSAGRAVWKYAYGLAPGILVWAVLVGWLANLLFQRANWSDESDRAFVREWLDETRNFHKTLPQLIRDYAQLRNETVAANEQRVKREEIAEHLRGLTEPTRIYLGQLPGFPVIHRIEVRFPPAAAGAEDRIIWTSPLPRPRQPERYEPPLEYAPLDPDGPVVRCEYQLHVYNRLQHREASRRRETVARATLLGAATLLAVLFVYLFLRRERRREIQRLTAVAQAEHREREVLEVRLQQREAERERDELDRKLLHQELDKATLQKRADEAEKSALEMKSQLYASIGIMAGSYAHNIKNLLVRPNDLLARCIEADGMTREQSGMLHEVRSTLGTVTERLQQILRTVRRDPGGGETTRIDLNQLVSDSTSTWAEMGRDKWKLTVDSQLAEGELWVQGDVSHLQQAIENLVFNARDATFEMRNHLREAARKVTDPTTRKQRLIEAAGWVGRVTLATRREDDAVVLEVRDTGIGMSEEVRANCLQTYFSTKRDNAIYEGYSAGMGLGLSFVAVVLEHHQAKLEIESEPLRGAIFRVRFPLTMKNPAG